MGNGWIVVCKTDNNPIWCFGPEQTGSVPSRIKQGYSRRSNAMRYLLTSDGEGETTVRLTESTARMVDRFREVYDYEILPWDEAVLLYG